MSDGKSGVEIILGGKRYFARPFSTKETRKAILCANAIIAAARENDLVRCCDLEVKIGRMIRCAIERVHGSSVPVSVTEDATRDEITRATVTLVTGKPTADYSQVSNTVN